MAVNALNLELEPVSESKTALLRERIDAFTVEAKEVMDRIEPDLRSLLGEDFYELLKQSKYSKLSNIIRYCRGKLSDSMMADIELHVKSYKFHLRIKNALKAAGIKDVLCEDQYDHTAIDLVANIVEPIELEGFKTLDTSGKEHDLKLKPGTKIFEVKTSKKIKGDIKQLERPEDGRKKRYTTLQQINEALKNRPDATPYLVVLDYFKEEGSPFKHVTKDFIKAMKTLNGEVIIAPVTLADLENDVVNLKNRCKEKQDLADNLIKELDYIDKLNHKINKLTKQLNGHEIDVIDEATKTFKNTKFEGKKQVGLTSPRKVSSLPGRYKVDDRQISEEELYHLAFKKKLGGLMDLDLDDITKHRLLKDERVTAKTVAILKSFLENKWTIRLHDPMAIRIAVWVGKGKLHDILDFLSGKVQSEDKVLEIREDLLRYEGIVEFLYSLKSQERAEKDKLNEENKQKPLEERIDQVFEVDREYKDIGVMRRVTEKNEKLSQGRMIDVKGHILRKDLDEFDVLGNGQWYGDNIETCNFEVHCTRQQYTISHVHNGEQVDMFQSLREPWAVCVFKGTHIHNSTIRAVESRRGKVIRVERHIRDVEAMVDEVIRMGNQLLMPVNK